MVDATGARSSGGLHLSVCIGADRIRDAMLVPRCSKSPNEEVCIHAGNGLPVTQRSAVVVVVDRLGAGWLGPYGNTWIETPGFNRLASQSLMFETALSDSAELSTYYRSVWSGQHAFAQSLDGPDSLCRLLGSTAVETHLLTDSQQLAGLPPAAEFDRLTEVPSMSIDSNAETMGDTQLARLFATAADAVLDSQEPFCLWVHATGLSGCWDAPLELREQFAEEDDPSAPGFVEVPDRRLDHGFDPDWLLGIQHACAGQVALLDACMEVLVDAIDASRVADNSLLIVTSPRGFPVGEHHRVGACDHALFGELIQVPLFCRFPEGKMATVRERGLIQPASLYDTLADWFDVLQRPSSQWAHSFLLPSEESACFRDRGFSVAAGYQAVRTPGWFLCTSDEEEHKLFVKPDDRREVNDVSSRREDVVELLLEVLQDARGKVHGEPLRELAKVLVDGPE